MASRGFCPAITLITEITTENTYEKTPRTRISVPIQRTQNTANSLLYVNYSEHLRTPLALKSSRGGALFASRADQRVVLVRGMLALLEALPERVAQTVHRLFLLLVEGTNVHDLKAQR